MAGRASKDGISKIILYRLDMDFSAEDSLSNYGRPLESGEKEGCSYEIFLNQKVNRPPAWKPLIKDLVDPDQIPSNSYTSLIIIFRKEGYCFALTAGYGYADVRKYAQRDFGIDIASKCVDPTGLDFLYQKVPTGNVYGLYRSLRGKYLPAGDPINRRSVLKTIRGKTIEEKLGAMVEGKISLAISGKKDFDDVLNMIDELIELDGKEEKTVEIGGLEEVSKEVKEQLNECLIGLINDGSFDDLLLGYDDDLIETFHCETIRVGRNPEEFLVDDVMAILEATRSASRTNPSNVKLKGFNFEGVEIFEEPLVNLIEGELDFEGSKYFRIDRKWYKTSHEYMEKINRDFLELSTLDSDYFNGWQQINGEYIGEGDFLESNVDTNKILAHTQRIENIEFADMIDTSKNLLVHVKRGKGAYLRNLFAQGFVSASLFTSDVNFKNQVQEKYGIDVSSKYTVVFAMFPETETKLDSIFTLFAKVDLLERQRVLVDLGYDVQYCLIPQG